MSERLVFNRNEEAQLFYSASFLRLLFENLGEIQDFVDVIGDVAEQFPSITGVLLTGTMTQRVSVPHPDELIRNPSSPLEKAYRHIFNFQRRKITPHPDSDIDIWLMTESNQDFDGVTATIAERGFEELHWLSNNLEHFDLDEWIRRKKIAFGEFYKQPHLYGSQELGELPWMAKNFTNKVIDHGEKYLEHFVKKVNYYMNKTWSSWFLEVRAFPPEVFNLRPAEYKNESGGILDKTPYPYYMKHWIDHRRNALVIYQKGNSPIYPFSLDGVVLGKNIIDAIDNDNGRVNGQ